MGVENKYGKKYGQKNIFMFDGALLNTHQKIVKI